MTKKQILFFKNLLESPSYAEAARRAGYSEKSCRVSAHKNITKYNDFLMKALAEAEVDPKSIGKLLKSGLSSKDERIRFRYLQLILKTTAKALESEEVAMMESIESEESKEELGEMIESAVKLHLQLLPYTQNLCIVNADEVNDNVKKYKPQEVLENMDLGRVSTEKKQ